MAPTNQGVRFVPAWPENPRSSPTQPQSLANLPDCVSTAMGHAYPYNWASSFTWPGSLGSSPVWLQSWTSDRPPPPPTRGPACSLMNSTSWFFNQISLNSENLFSGKANMKIGKSDHFLKCIDTNTNMQE